MLPFYLQISPFTNQWTLLLQKTYDAFSSKVLFLTNRLLELAATIDSSGKGKGKVRSEDDVLDNFETLIVDRMDQLLERVDISLDEYQGKTKPPAIAINPPVELSSVKKKKPSGQPAPVIQHAANLTKPPLKFKALVDNSNTPWCPRLKHKYHAQAFLGYKFLDQDSDASDSASTLSTHPYRYEIISFPKHGLAHLLETYCDFLPDKRYQLADWRIRPLPEEMLKYARSDTHFLLFIYDNLRNALLDRGESQARSQALEGGPSSFPVSNDSLLREVLARSQETSLKVYEKELYDAAEGTGSTGWDSLARKWNKGALLASAPNVGVAREEDESTRYLLPNHFLFQLAENPPADMAALLRVFHSPPPLMKRRARELLGTIRDAVRAHLSHSAGVSSIPEPRPQPVEVEHVDESVADPDTRATRPSTLWSGSTTSSSVASKSSLFGTALPALSVGYRNFAEGAVRKESSREVEMQAEIPFIPASQRQLREAIEDTLVVVGQVRQKKRKRVAPADMDDGTPGTEVTSSKKSKSGEGESAGQDLEPFDLRLCQMSLIMTKFRLSMETIR
ncbi:hypothetical protein ARMSODRAFT_1086260 [Armillaria solidipes]|uniref:HRDC domain-containing protein n=1 Tax=Armillaria solidipes TaxID=1076256 RepID=A0A2H3BMQ3_9AGAR|nr:hypothetical protein ARMSODRAFT_1086260 [Armillaria solidipes]